MQLSTRTLDSIRPEVARPGYDRSQVTVGIIHFGVGGFHRSHQAVYLDRLLTDGLAHDWGICGVGVLPHDARMRDTMQKQDCLYTVAVKHADGGRELRVIGSIVEYLFAPDDPEAVIERMCDPGVRIVSLTVTEGGYNISDLTGDFDLDDPAIVADARGDAAPATVFGLVTEALARRRQRGTAPFTIMSCDNIQGNGDVARRSFAAYARLRDSALADWMLAEVAFPNSMVDRITPVTTDDDRADVAERLGVTDDWPVVCEPFSQWVLEEHFPLGRPELERVGVQVVADVEPYELMKLRLLNATHQAMCYFGYLMGYRHVHEAAADPAIASMLLRYMDREATPTLRPVPGVDLEAYKQTLLERYRNPEVRDTLARLCAESSDRIPKWLLPVVREQLRRGGEIDVAAAVVASWARYAEGVDERGERITVVDRHSAELVPLALSQSGDDLAFIRDRALFGDLVDDERFVAPYRRALASLHAEGSRATVASLVTA